MIKLGFEYKEIARKDMWVNVGYGDKTWGMPLAALKTILMFWLFCGVCFFAYTAGKYDTSQNVLMTAYLAQGGIKTYDNKSMFCEPTLSQRGDLNWECVNSTEVIASGNFGID
jgi:hypothetical protein